MATKTSASKTTKVKAIPDGYHSITPYLVMDGAARAIDVFLMGASDLPAPDVTLGLAAV